MKHRWDREKHFDANGANFPEFKTVTSQWASWIAAGSAAPRRFRTDESFSKTD
jgi:hypothetical protein